MPLVNFSRTMTLDMGNQKNRLRKSKDKNRQDSPAPSSLSDEIAAIQHTHTTNLGKEDGYLPPLRIRLPRSDSVEPLAESHRNPSRFMRHFDRRQHAPDSIDSSK